MAKAERDLKAGAEWKRIQQNTFTRCKKFHYLDKQSNIKIFYLDGPMSISNMPINRQDIFL